MRAIINGRILAARTLPFSVDFSGLAVNNITFGANGDKTENGGFVLNAIAFVAATLSSEEAKEMTQVMAERTGVIS